ncbi:hypothetical protein B566_EDAN014280 [Ephemera danica]|nr:hypothetical protein B566_EDAN014280 [Ephemera danica]
MRKSSAPSFLKSRVSSGLVKTNENSSNKNTVSVPDPTAVRSTSRILSLLNGDPDTIEDVSCSMQSNNSEIENDEDSKKIPSADHQIQTPNVASDTSEKIIFEAVYRKMTSKKHKTWEGDGTVQVEGRCAILKDDTGKEMGRNSKVKADVIFEEGTQLLIGGKEVELGSILQRQAVQQRAPSPPLQVPVAKKMKFTVRQQRDDDLPLPTPSASHQWKYNSEGLPVNQVMVEGFLARALRPHQRDGIKFLYECVMGMRGLNPGQYWGALLADEMGLGKTLQCIALFWTLLNQKAYGRGGEIRRILIVAPRTLVDNWERDIYAWLGYRRVSVYKVNSKNSFQDYGKRLSKVAIASYETCVRQAAVVGSYEWDLLICDEAHCLKNPDTEKAK